MKKISDLEVAVKLVKIYKTLWRNGEKKQCEGFVMDILKFMLVMSRMKDRKLVLFG